MKKLMRRQKRFKGLTVGLDLHKKFIQVAVLDRHGNEIESNRLTAKPDALLEFVRRLCKRGDVQVSMEACGSFYWVFDAMVAELGRARVHVAHPAHLKAAIAQGRKDDASDAWWLAYFLWEGRLPEARPAEGVMRDLRIAGREYKAHKHMRGDLLRRLRSHAAQAGLALPSQWYTSKVKRAKTCEILRQVAGERGRAMKRLYLETLKLTQILVYWRGRMRELCAGFKVVQVLQRELPGMKAITAGIAFGEFGDPADYHSAKAYGKTTGLTPLDQQTGGKKKACGITREGSALGRWAYTTAVVACLRCKRGPGVYVKEWVEHRSQFKPKKKVITAAGRKLAEGAWRLFALGEAFDLKRAFPPPRRKAA